MSRLSKLPPIGSLTMIGALAGVGFLYFHARSAAPNTASASEPSKSPGQTMLSTILPEKTASLLTQLCSRWGTQRFEKTWLPTPADVQMLESRLDRISSLSSVGQIRKKRIENPSKYYRQYVGIVVQGRKLIYLNAFCDKPDDVVVRHGGDWRENFLDVCDGGDCFWSVTYDPISGDFSDLQINGFAKKLRGGS